MYVGTYQYRNGTYLPYLPTVRYQVPTLGKLYLLMVLSPLGKKGLLSSRIVFHRALVVVKDVGGLDALDVWLQPARLKSLKLIG